MAAKKKVKAPSRDARIDAAAESLMQAIDEHELSGSDVPRRDTIDLLRTIIGACRMRMETLEQEEAND